MCAYVSAVCMRMDLDTQGYIMWTTGPQTAQGQSSQFLYQDEVNWRKANCVQVKYVITVLNYFNRLAHNTLCLNNYPLTELVQKK